MAASPVPVLYSFRRCPYAMRARLAVAAAQVRCELREVVLRDKPDEMVAASPKATVPVLVLPDGRVVDESLEIMLWALGTSDPGGWMMPPEGSVDEMMNLIALCERDFKPHLDRYKYANRYEGADPIFHRGEAEKFLNLLEARLDVNPFLSGSRRSLADMAVAPFVRQFANTDRSWFDGAPYAHVKAWLAGFIGSPEFLLVMEKFDRWQPEDAAIYFPR